MKKRFVKTLMTAAVTVTLAGSLAACGSSKDSGSETASVSAGETADALEETAKDEAEGSTDKIENPNLRIIGWNGSIAHLDSVISYEGGYYEKNGLTVDYTYNNSNPDNIQALLQDKADLVSAGSAAELQYLDEGSDIVIIGGQMSLGETVYALPERADEFKELNEETLAGKKIGVTRMNTGDIAFRKILKDRGVDLSKIEFVELDSQATVTQAVVTGQVDLGINFLTFREAAENQGLVPVSQLDAEDEWPDYICCRLITTSKKLSENRAAYVAAVKSNIQAYALVESDPEKTIEIAGKGIEADKDVLQNQIYDYGHLGFSPDPNKRSTKEFYQAMVDVDYIKGNVNIDDHIDTSLYEDALNQLLEEEPDNEVYKTLQTEFQNTKE